MQHKHRLLAIAIAVVSVFGWLVAGEEPPRIGNAPLYAIGVVTSNVQETVQHYARIMGVTPPPVAQGSVEAPDGQKVTFRAAVVFLPNFYIKLFEPISKNGPYAAHVQKYGMSIQDAQFFVNGDIQAVRAGWEQTGARWTLGSRRDGWAYVNFHERLGTTIEIIDRGRGDRAVSVAPGAALPPLGSLPVTHLGFAVTDAHKTAKAYSDVFGITMPAVTEYRDAQYPPDSKWNKDAYLRVAHWQQGEIGMELIESVGGPTPWSEYVKKRAGNAAHHIAINVGDRMDETIRDLQMKGGKWTNGKPGGTYAYLDFTDTLGLVIEITGTSKSAAPAKSSQLGPASR